MRKNLCQERERNVACQAALDEVTNYYVLDVDLLVIQLMIITS